MEVSDMTTTLRFLMQIKKLKDFEAMLRILLTQHAYGEAETIKKIILDKSLTGPTNISLTSTNLNGIIEESIEKYFDTARTDVMYKLLLQLGFSHSDDHKPDFSPVPKHLIGK